MSVPFPQNIKYITIITLFIFGNAAFLFAQGLNLNIDSYIEAEALTELQKQARSYRRQGLELQDRGNLDGAMNFYQKAAQLDPAYATAYNDMGIIYETKGLQDRAESCYMRAIKIDPNYLSAYSNMAALYENNHEYEKAALYWQKREELGFSGDPWTEKAKERLDDICAMLGKEPSEIREQQIIGLMKDVAADKYIQRQDNRAFASTHFERAKLYYERGKEVEALKEAMDAQQLDPTNTEIEEFIEKVRIRVLSR